MAAAKKCMMPDIRFDRKEIGEPQASQKLRSTPGEELKMRGFFFVHLQWSSETPM